MRRFEKYENFPGKRSLVFALLLYCVPRSTAFNLARTLTDLDYVWFNAETNRYTLGLKMFEVGSMAIQRIDILSVIRSCMTEINQQITQQFFI